MSILRGERVTRIATLTPTKELHFSENHRDQDSLIQLESRRAFQKGESYGEKIGYAKAINETQMLTTLLHTLSRKLLEHKNQLIDHLKPEVIEFSITVCEQVIRHELSQPETFINLINSLLTYTATHLWEEAPQIILAPEDLAMLEEHLNTIHFDSRERGAVHFLADPLIRRGDCRIEMPSGLLNHMVKRQLADFQAKII